MVKRNGPLVVIRMTVEERDRLNAAASEARLSLNQWCRHRLGLHLEERSPSVQRLERRRNRLTPRE